MSREPRYDVPTTNKHVAKKQTETIVGRVGSLSETGGLLKNDAALQIEHLMGKQAAIEFGETLEELRKAPQQYSVVFKDGGLRLRAIRAIAEHGRVTDFPKDAVEVVNEFETYMTWCETFMIAPTIGMFAAWLGTSLDDYNSHVASYETTRPDAASMLKLAKETIRGFLETQAVDGNVAPAIYLHQNKAYFDAVETSETRHVKAIDDSVRDIEKIQEIIDLTPLE